MAEEQTYTQKVDEEHYKSHLRKEKFTPRKYKRTYKMGSKMERFNEGEEIKVGSRIVVRVPGESQGKSCVGGYLLCAVIDIQDDRDHWSLDTTFIVEVLDASNATVASNIGRLRVVGARNGWSWRSRMELVEIGKKGWDTYKVKQSNIK